MEHSYEDLTQNLKFENENSEMDLKGTVIKVELKSPLTKIRKPNERHENANQDGHIVEINNENHLHYENEQSQNALVIEEKIELKLENEEIRSYKCGKRLNSHTGEKPFYCNTCT